MPPAPDPSSTLTAESASHTATVDDPSRALEWIDPAAVTTQPGPAAGPMVAPDLLADVPLRRGKAALVPVLILTAIAGGYVATTLLVPTTALPPTVNAVSVEAAAAPAGAPVWPATGSAAIGIPDLGLALSSSQAVPMASITKVITVMTVLQAHPIALGEQGAEFWFDAADSSTYWQYLNNNESALDVPVDGMLTQYQMIEGILLGSAGNYTDALAEWAFPSTADFVAAADAWLASVGISDITVVEPTGIDARNTATPEALIKLGEAAMANPVFAEIAAKPSVELPGAGLVENTNGIINDPGVVGVKTGWLEGFNLLSAKDLDIAGHTVRSFAVVLGQDDADARNAESRALYDQLEQALQPQVAVPAGTTVAKVSSAWGATTTIRTRTDAAVSLWQGGSTVSARPALGDDVTAGSDAGELTATGVLGDAVVTLEVADDLDGPSPWWRLTHPLELFGIR